MRVLLTRPQADSEALARTLLARGIEADVAPMLCIVPMPEADLDLAGAQALLFTSANGVRAFVGRSENRALPVYAVGDATAEQALGAGFAEVRSAAGDVDDLARLVVAHADPAAGFLLHVAGSVVAGDLAGQLGRAGFDVRRAVLYRAELPEALPAPAADGLKSGAYDGVLFFSPRTARTFATLAHRAGVASLCARTRAFCLSAAVAEAAGAIAWRDIAVARRPEGAALLSLLEDRTDP